VIDKHVGGLSGSELASLVSLETLSTDLL
jgi:hypothetical protein